MSESKPWYISWGIPLVGSFAGIGAVMTWVLNLKLLTIFQLLFGSILLACEGTAFAAHFELSFPQVLVNIHNKITTLLRLGIYSLSPLVILILWWSAGISFWTAVNVNFSWLLGTYIVVAGYFYCHVRVKSIPVAATSEVPV